MVKSALTMVEKLQRNADYQRLKAWISSVEDWVQAYTQVMPRNLGPTAVRSVARMTLSAELYTQLEQAGGIGDRSGDGS